MKKFVRFGNEAKSVPTPVNILGVLGLGICLLVLSGCLGSQYHLIFSQIDGLKKDAPLLFENNTIGRVNQVAYTDQGEYRVSVSVEEGFTSAMTEFSRFNISPSPTDPSTQAVVMTHEKKGGTLLEKGSTVKAIPPKASMPFNEMVPMLKQLENGWDTFVKELKNIPESESFKAFENKLDELGRQMKESGSAFQDNIRNNIIPKLEKELEILRKKFEKSGEPEKTKPLEQKLKDLQDV